MNRSRMVAICARLVLRHADDERLLDEMTRWFKDGQDMERAVDCVVALRFVEVELGRASVELVLAKHKALAPV